MASKIAD